MRFTAISAFLGLAACVLADNITVQVAVDGALTFTPNTVTANQGDIVNFQFMTGNHTITQSTFSNPCTRLTAPNPGIDSGFLPVSANDTTIPQYSFTVDNATAPLWFYCKQGAGAHCRAGMVFAVNPTTDMTFAAFQANAANSTTSTSSSGPSTSKPSSTGYGPTPSATNNSTGGAVLDLNPSKVAGIITLVAVLAGSVL
jgi:plastocyanin